MDSHVPAPLREETRCDTAMGSPAGPVLHRGHRQVNAPRVHQRAGCDRIVPVLQRSQCCDDVVDAEIGEREQVENVASVRPTTQRDRVAPDSIAAAAVSRVCAATSCRNAAVGIRISRCSVSRVPNGCSRPTTR